MKILQINCVYPQGSTGRITAAIHRALLADGHESMVLHSRGKRHEDDHSIRVSGAFAGKINHLVSRVTGYPYGGCGLQTKKLLRIIKRAQPDVVHLQCINGYFVNIYRLVAYLKKKSIPTVMTLHADFMFTANCASAMGCEKWKTGCGACPRLKQATESFFFDRTRESYEKMKQAIEGFGRRLKVVGVSDGITARASLSPIMKDADITTIKNGINEQIFKPSPATPLRETLGIRDTEKLVLWVTSAYSYEKGADLFEALVSSMAGNGYTFAVAGADMPDGYTGPVHFLGKITDPASLAAVYAAADVSLCCSRQEAYPTVCLESQCCGTPVVGFDTGAVNETIHPLMGQTVPLGDVDAMADAVAEWCLFKTKITEATLKEVRERNALRRMTDAYLSLYRSMLE